ncbi:MAG: hypothetical protein FJY17_07055 [Bacteroidetes bacterium]|nr:hypothetical protein [Bacteroidota bacterium]
MTIHEHMALGRKLSKADDKSNTVLFLVFTAAGIGVAYYFKIQHLKKYKSQNLWLQQDNSRLKTQNRQQGEAYSSLVQENTSQQERIAILERDKQAMANQLMEKDKDKQPPQA